MKRIILASGSPRRTAFLDMIGIKHEIIVSGIDEDAAGKGNTPQDVVVNIALAKAKAAAELVDTGVIIGADTTVFCEGKYYGKPDDKEHAKTLLKELQGKNHTVYTGCAVIDKNGDKEEITSFCEEADVFISKITDDEICGYVETGEPLDKAGAYAIQGIGSVFVEKINGDFYTVAGLPLARLYKVLKEMGIFI